jgi:hypothetical protein
MGEVDSHLVLRHGVNSSDTKLEDGFAVLKTAFKSGNMFYKQTLNLIAYGYMN